MDESSAISSFSILTRPESSLHTKRKLIYIEPAFHTNLLSLQTCQNAFRSVCLDQMSANSAQIKTTSKTNFHQKTTKHTLQRLLLTIYLAFVFGSHSTSKPSSFMFAHAQSRTFAHRSGQYSLRSFQAHACFGQHLQLTCPKDSVISVYIAHVGPARFSERAKIACQTAEPQAKEVTLKLTSSMTESSNQLTTDSLLPSCSTIPAFTIVNKRCTNRISCDLPLDSSTFAPSVSELSSLHGNTNTRNCSLKGHYGEVVYHCKPSTDLSAKATCENRKLNLRCHRGQVLIIYRAYFGHIPDLQIGICRASNESPPDFQSNSVDQITNNQVDQPATDDQQDEECPLSNETGVLLKLCHGRNRCSFHVREGLFEPEESNSDKDNLNSSVNRCKKKGRVLKVLFTCASALLLPDHFLKIPTYPSVETGKETILSSSVDSNNLPIDPLFMAEHKPSKISIMPARTEGVSGVQLSDYDLCNCTSALAVGFVSEWLQAYYFIKSNKERLTLYFLISVLFALLCVVMATSVRLYWQKRTLRLRNKPTSSMPDEEQNHLLTGGSNTPQHDRTRSQSAQLSSSDEKDVNSNLLHGNDECTAVKRPDTMFDEDSLAAAFSTPEVQRRCSELAQMTFHHFRHSPQPPTGAAMSPETLFATYPFKGGSHQRPAVPVQIVYSSGEEFSDLGLRCTINDLTGGTSAATTATCSPRETFLASSSFSPIPLSSSATAPTFPVLSQICTTSGATVTSCSQNFVPYVSLGNHNWTHSPHRRPNLLVQQDISTGQTTTSLSRPSNI